VAVLIRLAGAEDASRFAAIYKPYVESTRITFEEVPPTADDIVERMSSPVHPWLAAELAERVVGYASTAPMRARSAYRWSVETGIYLAPEAQGRGVGKMLLMRHVELLERQGFVSGIAGIALPNVASVAAHESAGFRLMGIEEGVGFKLGAWSDVARYQRDLAPRANPPAELRPFADCFDA